MLNDSDVLRKLLEEGKITQADVDKIYTERPSREICAVVDIFHTFLCRGPHTGKDCCVYLDENDEWDMPYHRKWIGHVLRYRDYFKVDDIIGTMNSFTELLAQIGNHNEGLCVLLYGYLSMKRDRRQFVERLNEAGHHSEEV